ERGTVRISDKVFEDRQRLLHCAAHCNLANVQNLNGIRNLNGIQKYATITCTRCKRFGGHMSLLGKAALAMWWDMSTSRRPEFEHWHTHEHFPERLGILGFHRATRWTSADG